MGDDIKISMESINPIIGDAGKGSIQWQGRMRKIYDNELIYFISANGIYIMQEKKYTVEPGTFILIKPDMAHTFILDNGYKYMWAHFDFHYREDQKSLCEYLKKNYSGKKYIRPDNEMFLDNLPHTEWIREQPVFDTAFPFPDYFKVRNRETIEILFNKLIYEFSKKNSTYQIKCKSILLDIFNEVIHQQMIYNCNNDNINYSKNKIFDRLNYYIEHNYYKKIKISDLENLTGLTRSYISRIIKEKTSYSTIEYINAYRINKAKDLFAQNDLKIVEISEMVGFENIHYFSEIFKKYEGISPRKYYRIKY